MKKYTKPDQYFEDKEDFQKAHLVKLRSILVSCDLEEAIKWHMPAYLCDGKNIIALGSFKKWVALWFHQGVYLSDPAKKLFNVQEGKTAGMRHWRFLEGDELPENQIRSYIEEAIANSRKGLEIKPQKGNSGPIVIPELIKQAFKDVPGLKTKFELCTEGMKKEYCNYITNAKRAETKLKRLEKIIPLIEQRKRIY